MGKPTPGPWKSCNNGKCKCGHIYGDDNMIAEVTVGEWGDTYPALRNTEGSIGQLWQPYIEMIAYGEVNEETAKANRILIAAAPDLLEALENILITYDNMMASVERTALIKKITQDAIAKAKGE